MFSIKKINASLTRIIFSVEQPLIEKKFNSPQTAKSLSTSLEVLSKKAANKDLCLNIFPIRQRYNDTHPCFIIPKIDVKIIRYLKKNETLENFPKELYKEFNHSALFLKSEILRIAFLNYKLDRSLFLESLYEQNIYYNFTEKTPRRQFANLDNTHPTKNYENSLAHIFIEGTVMQYWIKNVLKKDLLIIRTSANIKSLDRKIDSALLQRSIIKNGPAWLLENLNGIETFYLTLLNAKEPGIPTVGVDASSLASPEFKDKFFADSPNRELIIKQVKHQMFDSKCPLDDLRKIAAFYKLDKQHIFYFVYNNPYDIFWLNVSLDSDDLKKDFDFYIDTLEATKEEKTFFKEVFYVSGVSKARALLDEDCFSFLDPNALTSHLAEENAIDN